MGTSIHALARSTLALVLLLPVGALAQEPVAPPPPAPPGPAAPEKARRWGGEAELGYVETGGNTRTTTANAKAGLRYEPGRWRHSLRGEALYAEDRSRTTAQRFAAQVKSDYRVSERTYVFATGRYEAERFTGFDYRVSEAAGAGRRLIVRPRLTLEAEAGPGGRHARREDGRHEDDLIGLGTARLAWRVGAAATVSEEVTLEVGEEGRETESVTALTTRVVGSLAMKLSFTLRNRSEVPPGTRHTDTITAATLVYSF